MASTYLSRTQTTATDRKKLTLSTWIKRGNLSGGSFQFFVSSYISSNDRIGFYFNSDDSLSVFASTSGTTISLQTSRLFRDISAWYHIVYEIDTTQATASDRVKIYVNGEQETSFQTATYPTQNSDIQFGTSSYNMYVGNYDATQYYFDGSMTHVHFIDGTAYDASYFGQYDANGVWTIKTSPSVTYGTNGFFILKDGNSVTDQSGNGNNFTVAGGTLTNTEDSPSNVFATANPIDFSGTAPTLGNGNLSLTTVVTSDYPFRSTLAFSKGKYYCEVKHTDASNNNHIGIWSADNSLTSNYVGYQLYSWGIFTPNGNKRNNQSYDSYGSAIAQNDIIMIAVDKDNGKIWWGKNGTWFNSGDPVNGTNEAFSNINTVVGTDGFIAFCSLTQATHQWNFGNGYFGTTAVASAGTNASGIGIFEYDVPTGYTALSTKGLNL